MNGWIDPIQTPDGDDLVQVLCEVLPDTISVPPRSCDMAISTGDHATGDRFVSIGYPVFGITFDGVENGWTVAGWSMTQDCWTPARHFKVIAWQPLAPTEYTPT